MIIITFFIKRISNRGTILSYILPISNLVKNRSKRIPSNSNITNKNVGICYYLITLKTFLTSFSLVKLYIIALDLPLTARNEVKNYSLLLGVTFSLLNLFFI